MKKLTEDKEFGRRLKAAGFVERVYESFRKAGAGDGDKVLFISLLLLLWLFTDTMACRIGFGFSFNFLNGIPAKRSKSC